MRRRILRDDKILMGLISMAIVNAFVFMLRVVTRHGLEIRMAQRHEARSNITDWNNEILPKNDMARVGKGEQGKALNLTHMNMEKVEMAYSIYAYNTLASVQIAFDRSLPDVRHIICKTKKYLSNLPSVSIIIVFHNEHWTVIIRSILSIINRSPPELIKEIIIVNDASTVIDVLDLEQYVVNNLPKVRILHLSKRSGLIAARLAGARIASATVLIFLDAHVEANYNWLPPLLEPIVENPKTCVCPLVDIINYDTFQYTIMDNGGRGAFDWYIWYIRLPVLPEEQLRLPQPYRSPVMMGGLFAIASDFFWELGGYDEELDIWGGEQFELSFKIWMCGGQMLDAPCSRFGHIFPAPGKYAWNPRTHDYLHKNLKRVAEVWMDEYKEFVYMRNPTFYRIDAGNLTKQIDLRSRLNCKSFKWYLEKVAVDLLLYLPPEFPSSYASGAILNDGFHNLCLDLMNGPIGIFECAQNLVRPHRTQHWFFTYKNELRIIDKNNCADSYETGPNAKVYMLPCHSQGGNQFWQYDFKKKWLKNKDQNNCLEGGVDGKSVFVNPCNASNIRMRWTFGVKNETASIYLKL